MASLLQRYRSTKANQTLHSVWPLPGLVEYMYIHFRRLLLRNRILPGAKFTLRPPSLALSYWQCYCTAVEQWARDKLCDVEHRAPPIFGRATITFGIGPHSSSFFVSSPNFSRRRLDVYHIPTHSVALVRILRCRSETCCTRLAEKNMTQKIAKNSSSGTIAQLCRAMSSQLRHVSTIGKKTC